MGGYTALACGISTVFEGLIGGMVHKFGRNVRYEPVTAFFAGVLAEAFQMVIILLPAFPFSRAVALVRTIAVPMMRINPLGAAVFVNIEKARFGQRLQADFAVPDEIRSQRIPSFILQPIVENSIKHGILRRAYPGGGRPQRRGDRVCHPGRPSRHEQRAGGRNFAQLARDRPAQRQERLRLMYNRSEGICISSQAGKGTVVTFTVTARTPS